MTRYFLMTRPAMTDVYQWPLVATGESTTRDSAPGGVNRSKQIFVSDPEWCNSKEVK